MASIRKIKRRNMVRIDPWIPRGGRVLWITSPLQLVRVFGVPNKNGVVYARLAYEHKHTLENSLQVVRVTETDFSQVVERQAFAVGGYYDPVTGQFDMTHTAIVDKKGLP